MTKNVLLTLSGKHVYDDAEEPIELMTNATYELVDGRHVVQYEQMYEENIGKTVTEISAAKDMVELTNTGAANSHMCFSKNKIYESTHEYAEGTLYMTVNTTELDVTASENELTINIEYELAMNDSHISDNVMNIRVVSRA